MKRVAALLGLVTLATACSSEVVRLEQENAKLRSSIDSLTQRIAMLEDAPGARYADAVAHLEDGEFEAARRGFETLIDRYPGTEEAQRARAGVQRAQAAMDSAAREEEGRRRAAEAERRRLEQERLARQREIERGIVKRRDDVENVTWHHARGSESWQNYAAYGYVGQRGSSYWMRLRLATRTRDWIFWDRVIFNVDGRQITFGPFESWDKKSHVGYGSLREWIDIEADEGIRRQLREIADGREVKLRFRGEFYRDYTFAESDKRRLGVILDYHDQVR